MLNEFAETLSSYQLVMPIKRVSHKFSVTFDMVYSIILLLSTTFEQIVLFQNDDTTQQPVWSQKTFDDMRQIAEQVKVVVW